MRDGVAHARRPDIVPVRSDIGHEDREVSGFGCGASNPGIAVSRHGEVRIARRGQAVRAERNVIGVAAVVGRGGPEIPRIGEFEVRSVDYLIGKFEFRRTPIGRTDKHPRRHLKVLDQQVEAGTDRRPASLAVDRDTVCHVPIHSGPYHRPAPSRGWPAGAGQHAFVLVGVDQHGLADPREVRPAHRPRRLVAGHRRQRPGQAQQEHTRHDQHQDIRSHQPARSASPRHRHVPSKRLSQDIHSVAQTAVHVSPHSRTYSTSSRVRKARAIGKLRKLSFVVCP